MTDLIHSVLILESLLLVLLRERSMRNQRTSMPNKLNESVFRSVLIAGTGFLQAWEWFGGNIA